MVFMGYGRRTFPNGSLRISQIIAIEKRIVRIRVIGINIRSVFRMPRGDRALVSSVRTN